MKRFFWIKLTVLTLCLLLIGGSGFKSTQGIEQVSKEDFFKNLPPILQKYLPYSSEFKVLFDSGIITSEAELQEAKSRLEELKQSLPKETFIPLTPEEEKELKEAWLRVLKEKLTYLIPASFSTSEIELFSPAGFPLALRSEDIGINSSTGQRLILTYVTVYNIFGGALVTLYHQLHWFWDENIITSVYPLTWGVCHAPGWEYVGITVSSGYYYNNRTAYHSFRQGYFRLGAGGIYISHVYPWISADIYRGGGYNWYGSW